MPEFRNSAAEEGLEALAYGTGQGGELQQGILNPSLDSCLELPEARCSILKGGNPFLHIFHLPVNGF